jgi:hypothetical protein
LQSNETITQLSGNLTKAQKWSDQIEDQLQANNTDLAAANEHLNLLSQQNAAWKNEALTLQKQIGKTNFIAFGFGAAGFAIGTPLITEGIHSDNQAMLWAGTGTIIGTTGIWLLGHYMFHWW